MAAAFVEAIYRLGLHDKGDHSDITCQKPPTIRGGCVDRIDLFRTFARVVECSSFTRAADTLGVPRSSVSAAVQELEGRSGHACSIVHPQGFADAGRIGLYERCSADR